MFVNRECLRAVCFGLVLLACASARADDLDVLRTRVSDALLATDLPEDDPRRIAFRDEVGSWGQTVLGRVQADGSIARVTYTDSAGAVNQAGWVDHYRKVLALARAYAVEGNPLHHRADVLAAVVRALEHGATYFCGRADCVRGNWWEWQIGIPREFGQALFLLQGELDDALFARELARVRFHVGPYQDMAALQAEERLTGANLIERALNHVRFALMSRDAAELEAVRAVMEKLTDINPGTLRSGDGIKPDLSFQQHRGLPYTGGYGASFASSIMGYVLLAQDTAYQLSDAAVHNSVGYVAEGVRWTIVGNSWDIVTVGRYYSRKGGSIADAGRDALLRASQLSSAWQPDVRATAKAALSAAGPSGVELARLEYELLQTSQLPAWPSGHRHFYSSDHTVHRRDGYYASVHMYSTRTQSCEIVNGEGKLCARSADGSLYLVRDGNEFFGRGLWPAVDWARLSGITVEQTERATRDEDRGVGLRDFVGGTSDGQNGVSAMDLEPLGSSVRARKSWFFFDDFIVFLGSGIGATSEAPVETIVHQWPLSTADAALTTHTGEVLSGALDTRLSDVSWLAADGWGYYFPERSGVHVEIKQQAGDWSKIGTGRGPVEATFMTLALEHGVRPSNASYAYAIALKGQDMASWTEQPPFVVVQNDAHIAAVRSGEATGIVFWQPGTLELASDVALTLDVPGVVWARDDGNDVHVYVADPTAQAGELHVALTGDFAEVVALDDATTFVEAPQHIDAVVRSQRGETHGLSASRFGHAPSDAGTPDRDSGLGEVAEDAAVSQHDAGAHTQDAGTHAQDAGTHAQDAGTHAQDPGSPSASQTLLGGCSVKTTPSNAGGFWWLFFAAAVCFRSATPLFRRAAAERSRLRSSATKPRD